MKSLLRFLSAAACAACLTAGAQDQDSADAETRDAPAASASEAKDPGPFTRAERDLFRTLAGEVSNSLRRSAVPADKPVAILPIGGDSEDFALGLFKTAATDAGRNCVEGRLDPMWPAISEEIAWNIRKSANLLLYGKVRTLKNWLGLPRVEAELHVSSVLTKQHVWGDSFVLEQPIPWKIVIAVAVVLLVLLLLFLRAATRVR